MTANDIMFLALVDGGIASVFLAPFFLLLAVIAYFKRKKSNKWNKAFRIFLFCVVVFGIYAILFASFIHELQK
ncbi:hypothetical protein P256_00722 [Acinetobacter nectaris CIP 110549]|uniref:Uncharacterized protein n=1 Tax=Acinetobacter nectaris CIP 110549 TaxID=1392540 RepID=V2TXB2_9GAMM|nr:hypothetical protein [Acinetobacter nectaris]ESK40275.1 hypothetical protein P256_00722 [Acinetobacter nectaris CIP 110549]